MIEPFVSFLGRLHPVVLHIPIGALVALAACEAAAFARRAPLERGVRLVLIWLTALSGAAAAGAGWLLASEGGYAGSTVTLHRWLGVGLAAGVLLAAVGAAFKRTWLYAGALIASLGLMGPAGHFGGTITHGAGFLTAPFAPESSRARPGGVPGASEVSVAAVPGLPSDVGAMFAAHCVDCHNESKKKAGLAMHTAAALFAGSDYGPVIVAGDPGQSELAIRLRLPLDDEYHMPPEDRPQPTDAEIRTIIDWIAAGAPGDGAGSP